MITAQAITNSLGNVRIENVKIGTGGHGDSSDSYGFQSTELERKILEVDGEGIYPHSYGLYKLMKQGSIPLKGTYFQLLRISKDKNGREIKTRIGTGCSFKIGDTEFEVISSVKEVIHLYRNGEVIRNLTNAIMRAK